MNLLFSIKGMISYAGNLIVSVVTIFVFISPSSSVKDSRNFIWKVDEYTLFSWATALSIFFIRKSDNNLKKNEHLRVDFDENSYYIHFQVEI